MKKLTYVFLGVAGLSLASCSQEEVANPSINGEGNFHITVNLPNTISTRAISDGLAATKLHYAVYDANDNNSLVFDAEGSFVIDGNKEIKTTVDMNLVSGKNYNIVFFAQSADSENSAGTDTPSNGVYDFNATNKTVTVNYNNMNATGNNADAYDCFYGTYSVINAGTTTSANVTLNRPVARISWCTSDLDEAAVKSVFGTDGAYIQSTLSTKPYTSLNLLTGEVTGQPENDVTLGAFNIPSSTETSPVADYTWIAYQYVLVPTSTSATLDLTINFTDGGNTSATTPTNVAVNVSSAPVQGNYQTNIYGALLTDNTTFTVTKSPTWTYPSYLVSIEAVEPEKSDDGYQMDQEGNFIWLANEVNNGNSFYGETFVLQSDLDFQNVPMAPIGYYWTPAPGQTIPTEDQSVFLGSFDGNNKTISNVVIDSSLMPPFGTNVQGVGLFGYLSGTEDNPIEVKNLTINNITVNSTKNGTAGFLGRLGSYVTVDNVNITGTVIINTQNGHNNVGGFMAVIEGSNSSVTNCSIKATAGSNSGLIASGAVGGMISQIDATASDITINGLICENFGVYGTSAVGGIIGKINAVANKEITLSNCSFSGATINVSATNCGGIVGAWYNAAGYTTTLENCTFSGTFAYRGANATDNLRFMNANNTLVGATSNGGDTALGTLYLINDGQGENTNVAEYHVADYVSTWLETNPAE